MSQRLERERLKTEEIRTKDLKEEKEKKGKKRKKDLKITPKYQTNLYAPRIIRYAY
ncbi:MAG: hypothetical protein LCH63_05205 [Candidatus Melainabacteria bacterium]|nr:hypothetical protein [Candidatus Melainabacteria bacterium]